MNQCYLWATPSGPINLIEGDKMPVIPERPIGCLDYVDIDRKNYQATLQAAKASSVPVQDEIVRADWFWCMIFPELKGSTFFSLERGVHLYYRTGNTHGYKQLKPDTIYGPFTVEYEIKEECKDGACPYELGCFECQEPVIVAILYDDTPEKDHDTVLKEFADKMSKQEDIPKDIQAVVNKRFWDMLDTPEKEESQEAMLLEIFEDYKLLNISRDKGQFRAFIAMELSKFTITRKQ